MKINKEKVFRMFENNETIIFPKPINCKKTVEDTKEEVWYPISQDIPLSCGGVYWYQEQVIVCSYSCPFLQECNEEAKILNNLYNEFLNKMKGNGDYNEN